MTELELLAEVTALCDRLGLLWHHDPDSRFVKGTPGFPDLVIVGKRVLWAELKSDLGDTSAEQDLWHWTLHRADQTVAIWRPRDLENGAVEALLRGIT